MSEENPTPPSGPAADRNGPPSGPRRDGPPSGPRAGGDGPPSGPRGGGDGPPSGPRGGGDRPGGGGGGFGDRPGGGGGGFGDRPGGGRFGGRGGRPGDRGDRPRAPQTVKGRLRAKARKKARRLQKQAARGGKVFARKKLSRLTTDSQLEVDYRDPKTLRYFLTETGKIVPRRISGNTAKQQREVCLAIKRARHLALVAYPGQVD
ncbi:MAG TPA: 30S ribosomal protein S18 [Myxococcota bacterium]|nr:30S ribosomal protein S18 [Myxococcota bacterium]